MGSKRRSIGIRILLIAMTIGGMTPDRNDLASPVLFQILDPDLGALPDSPGTPGSATPSGTATQAVGMVRPAAPLLKRRSLLPPRFGLMPAVTARLPVLTRVLASSTAGDGVACSTHLHLHLLHCLCRLIC